MGYIENVMGDNERELYRTHQHAIVLFQQLLSSLFTFLVFLAVGLAILLPSPGESGDEIRFVVGLITLGSVVMPLYLIVSAWLRGLRGREFTEQIWRAALSGVLILIFSLIMIISPRLRVIGWIALVIAVVPAVELVRIFLDWLNERYIITNRRVMEIRGTINKHVRDSALEKVNDVELDQSVVGRVLNYGTVQIITGSDIGVNMFRRISNPVRFKREMLNAKENLHQTAPLEDAEEGVARKPTSQPGELPQPEPESPEKADIPELISDLAELHKKGILTDEEFQTKKNELLARL
jgi:hypothetical protein